MCKNNNMGKITILVTVVTLCTESSNIKNFVVPAQCVVRMLVINVGRDCTGGIATRYGLGGPGIEFRWE